MNVASPISTALSQINYTYDQINQLTRATKNVSTASDETFTYDTLGNRLKKNNQATNNAFDENNRLIEDETFTYSYDDNGNLVKKITKQSGYTYKYVWDKENRLQFITEHTTQNGNAVKTHTYIYDVLGRRIMKDSNGVIRKYVYDNEDILFEFDNDDNLKAKYTHGVGIDEPVEMVRNNQAYFYQVDGLGSIRALTDTNGNTLQSYSYNAYGETRVFNSNGVEISASLMIENPYGYTSREWDFETSSYYYRARYYDPRTGRFITADPVGFKAGFNLYRYVGNNPLGYSDPFGTTQCDIDLAISIVSSKYPGHNVRVGSASETKGVAGRYDPKSGDIILSPKYLAELSAMQAVDLLDTVFHEVGHANAPWKGYLDGFSQYFGIENSWHQDIYDQATLDTADFVRSYISKRKTECEDKKCGVM